METKPIYRYVSAVLGRKSRNEVKRLARAAHRTNAVFAGELLELGLQEYKRKLGGSKYPAAARCEVAALHIGPDPEATR